MPYYASSILLHKDEYKTINQYQQNKNRTNLKSRKIVLGDQLIRNYPNHQLLVSFIGY